MLFEQRADHSRSIHSANLRNFRRRYRLLVRNNGQRLQRWHRQPQRRPQALDEPPHHVMLLRLGVHLVPARHRANLDPPLFRRVTRHQFIERRLHGQFFFAKRLRQLLDCRRLIRRVNNRFQRRFSLFIRHASTLFPALSASSVLKATFTLSMIFPFATGLRSAYHESLPVPHLVITRSIRSSSSFAPST